MFTFYTTNNGSICLSINKRYVNEEIQHICNALAGNGRESYRDEDTSTWEYPIENLERLNMLITFIGGELVRQAILKDEKVRS